MQIELSVPRGILPQGMTIVGEDPITLNEIFGTLACLLTGGTDCGDLTDEVLRVLVGDQEVTYTYTTDEPVVIGQPFPIRLNVVGDDIGDFDVVGTVSSVTDMMLLALDQSFVSSSQLEPSLTPLTVTQTIRVNALSNVLDCDSLPQSAIVAQLADTYRFVIQESDLIDESEVRASCRAVVNTANALQRFAAVVPEGPDYESSADAFINIMLGTPDGTITYSNTTDRTQVGELNCITGIISITCGEGNVMSQFTMVHESGHVFVEQSTEPGQGENPCPPSGSSTPSFLDCIQYPISPNLPLRTNRFVFGPRSINYTERDVEFILAEQALEERFSDQLELIPTADDFTYFDVPPELNELGTPVPRPPATQNEAEFYRGEEGWGSEVSSSGTCGTAATAQTGFSQFQQNPCQVLTWIELELIEQGLQTQEELDELEQIELTEAAADMFLNWVYRTNEELGFPDTPEGDARFTWMDSVLRVFFAYFSW